MATPISKENLVNDGWELLNDPVLKAQKKIENRNPLNDSEDSEIAFCVHGMYNTDTFAILLPDGAMLNIHVTSMEELQAFEKAIDFYDPPF